MLVVQFVQCCKELVNMCSYRIAGFFEGEIFHEFHESIAIRENFTLEIFPLQMYYK